MIDPPKPIYSDELGFEVVKYDQHKAMEQLKKDFACSCCAFFHLNCSTENRDCQSVVWVDLNTYARLRLTR